MVQSNRRGSIAPPATTRLKSTEDPRLILTITFGSLWSPNRGSLSLWHGIDDPQPAHTPDGTSLSEHQGARRGVTLLHNPMTPFQMESPACGPTAAPRPYWCEHTHTRALVWPKPCNTCSTSSRPHLSGLDYRAEYNPRHHPLAPRSPNSRCHTPSSSQVVAEVPRCGQVSQRGILELQGGQKVSPPPFLLTETPFAATDWTLQPISVPLRRSNGPSGSGNLIFGQLGDSGFGTPSPSGTLTTLGLDRHTRESRTTTYVRLQPNARSSNNRSKRASKARPKACDAFTETRLVPAFPVSTGLHVEHRRPKAGDAPHEGLLKVERREFRCLGFRCLGFYGLRFWCSGFRVYVLGFWVFGFRSLGLRFFRVQGWGCRV